MNKTINANIAGFSFTLDEDAYLRLKNYLDRLNLHFSREEGSDEIMRDIEARLAEMLLDLIGKREVVSTADIEAVIKQMGMPEDFDIPQDESQPRTENVISEEPVDKRFYRDKESAVLGGVCSGISAYFNVDPLWLRIAFVVGFFVFGGGLLLYLILWIIMPEARTSAERLRMRGQRVTVSNIEQSVREGLKDAREGINKAVPGVRNSFERFGGVFLKLLGIFFILVGIIMLAGVVMALVGGGSFLAISFPLVKEHLFEDGWQQPMSTIGLLLVIGIPIIVLLVKGVTALMGLKFKSRVFNGAMLLAWLAGLGFAVAVGVDLGTDFSRGGSFVTEEQLQPSSRTICVKPSRSVPHYSQNHHDLDIDIEGSILSEDSLATSKVSLNITGSDDSTTSLLKSYFARGRSRYEAQQRASMIEHEVSLRDSILYVDPWLTTGEEPWRGQRVELTLQVPQGTTVRVSHELNYMLVEGYTYDRQDGDASVRF